MKILTREQEAELLYEALFCRRVDRLVQQYWNLVFHIIRRLFVYHHIQYDISEIEELRNDIFLELLKDNMKKLWQYDEKQGLSLASWIIMITSRLVLNKFRSRDIFSFINKKKMLQIEDILSETDKSSTEKFDFFKRTEYLLNAAEMLSARERLIIKLFYFDGNSSEECAAFLCMKRGAFDTAKSRTVGKLRKILEKEYLHPLLCVQL